MKRRRPDPDCENCDGVGCMDCRTRTVHDECVSDCPTCCRDAPEPVDPRVRIVADHLRKAIAYRLGIATLGALDTARDLEWLLTTGENAVRALDAAEAGREPTLSEIQRVQRALDVHATGARHEVLSLAHYILTGETR